MKVRYRCRLLCVECLAAVGYAAVTAVATMLLPKPEER